MSGNLNRCCISGDAKKIIEVMKIHYNFCREHQSLGMTPSEAAGIKLQLDENKIDILIRPAAVANRLATTTNLRQSKK